MGYLPNTADRTVTAIITRKGREKLSRGGAFRITKFALGDDEIDYSLWNEDHPLGTDSYGAVIEAIPLLEPLSNEVHALRYKLVTLPKDTVKMPIITVGSPSITLQHQGDEAIISPNTFNGNNDRLGYTAILHDNTAGELLVSEPIALANPRPYYPILLPQEDQNRSIAVVGRKFVLRAKRLNANVNTQVTVIGNETGGTTTVTVSVERNDDD